MLPEPNPKTRKKAITSKKWAMDHGRIDFNKYMLSRRIEVIL